MNESHQDIEQQNTPESHRLTVKVDKVLHFENMWGIVSVKPMEVLDDNFYPELSAWNNFIVRGNFPFKPGQDQELDIEISDKKTDPKRNNATYYETVRVHIEALNTVQAQQRFLHVILSEYRANLIINAFPDSMIIDDIRDNKIDLTSINGIGQSTANDVKREILANKDMGALMVELEDLNLTGRMLKKLLQKYNGDATIALFAVKESLYNLCSISGISFKRVDDAALGRGESRTSPKRIKAYSEHYFDEIASKGHSWVNERVFLEQSMAALGVNAKFVRDYMESDEGKEFFYWQQGDKRISSMRMYNNEKNTLKNLLRISSKYQPPKNLNIEGAIANAEDLLGISYTDEQKNAVMEAMQHGVFILNGSAGTGKSTVVKCIVEVLNSIDQTYTASALSGKASQVLLSKGIQSATLHRTFGLGMGDNKRSNKSEDEIAGTDSEEMGDTIPTSNINVFIIDETSMVNAAIFSEILPQVKDGAKIILVGDSGQLSAIGHGDVLRDLLATSYFPTFELQQIHRQAEDSGIIEVANFIREGKQIIKSNFEGKAVFGVNKDMLIFGYQEKESIPGHLKRALEGQKKLIKNNQDLLDFQIAVAMNEKGELSTRAINILAQSIFNDLEKPFISYGGYDFRTGDKVIVKGNSYKIDCYEDMNHYENVQLFGFSEPDNYKPHKKDLFNGTMGIAIGIEEVMNYKTNKLEKRLIVEFEGFGIKVFEPTELEIIELAYATTCHRLQGSTIKNVVVALDYSAFTLLSRQWVYTAITRASNKCVLMIQSSALVKAISTDASGNRQTFLGDMIETVKRNT